MLSRRPRSPWTGTETVVTSTVGEPAIADDADDAARAEARAGGTARFREDTREPAEGGGPGGQHRSAQGGAARSRR